MAQAIMGRSYAASAPCPSTPWSSRGEHWRPRAVRGHNGVALERGVALRVQNFETDIELRRRVPLGPHISFPEGDVGAAAVARKKRDRQRGRPHREHTARRGRTRGLLQDQGGGVGVNLRFIARPGPGRRRRSRAWHLCLCADRLAGARPAARSAMAAGRDLRHCAGSHRGGDARRSHVGINRSIFDDQQRSWRYQQTPKIPSAPARAASLPFHARLV
jgi:hypothetical protein